jgi:hypothetical protein
MNKLKTFFNKHLSITGLFISLVGAWGGCCAFNFVEYEDWKELAIILTAGEMYIIGLVLCIKGLLKNKGENK